MTKVKTHCISAVVMSFLLLFLTLCICMISAFATDDEGGTVTIIDDVGATDFADTTVEAISAEEMQEIVDEVNEDVNTAFHVAGNGTVIDDIVDVNGSKEFYTITTDNGGTFFLIIDRSAGVDNVYLLSKVDEEDLWDFTSSSSSSSSSTETTSGNETETTTTTTTTTEEGATSESTLTEEEIAASEAVAAASTSSSSSSGTAIVILIILIIIVVVVIVVVRSRRGKKNKNETEENMEDQNPDEMQ